MNDLYEAGPEAPKPVTHKRPAAQQPGAATGRQGAPGSTMTIASPSGRAPRSRLRWFVALGA